MSLRKAIWPRIKLPVTNELGFASLSRAYLGGLQQPLPGFILVATNLPFGECTEVFGSGEQQVRAPGAGAGCPCRNSPHSVRYWRAGHRLSPSPVQNDAASPKCSPAPNSTAATGSTTYITESPIITAAVGDTAYTIPAGMIALTPIRPLYHPDA